MRSGLLFICLCLWVADLHAQNFSNKGKDFWLGYGFHVNMGLGVGTNQRNAQDMVLYFTSDKNATVTVEIPGVGYKQTFQVQANQVTETTPLPKSGSQDCRIIDTGYYNRGIHVYSDVDIVAYAHIYNASVSGATLLYPTNTLGKEYYAIIYNQASNASFANSFAFVVAVEEGTTTVEITPSDVTLNKSSTAPFQVTLLQGQVYNLMGTTSGSKGTDLTGTRIRTISSSGACKKIAVFCGSGKMSIGASSTNPSVNNNQTGSADNIFAQATPASAWGLKYLTAPTGSQPNNYFRICVSDPTTKVKLNGAEIPTTLLQRSFFYELKNSSILTSPGNGIGLGNSTTGVWNLIEADKPITVAQYCTTQGNDGNSNTFGDPEMIYLSPVEQTINNITLNSTTRDKIIQHYINVIIKKGGVASFKLDGVSKSTSFLPHPREPEFSYAIFPVTSGSHALYSDTGYNAIAYGFGSAESYGYNAGTNIKDLYAPIFQNPYSRLDFAATCVGSTFQFSVPLSYVPTSITWDFGNSSKISPNTNIGPITPIPDSTPIVNGKQLYFFSPANGPTPKNFIYTATGNDTIRLFATNPSPDGCSSSNAEYVIPVVVNPTPRANFSIPPAFCLGKPIQFTDTSTDLVNSTVVNGLWNWGDGTTDSLKNPTHIFTKEGNFSIRYRPITDFGCVGDTTITISITGSPVAGYTMKDSTCLNKTLTFSDVSTISSGSIVKWYWNYGDGRTDTQTSGLARTIAYTATGSYSVSLTVENGSGCQSETFSKTILIRPIPKPNFNLPIVCLPEGIARFYDSTTIADGSGNFRYSWDFGDGVGIDSIANPIYKYKQTGPFNIRLQVTTPYGCVDSINKTIESIYQQAKASFTFNPENCLRDSSYFTDATDGKGSAIQKWQWSFGDAVVDSLQNPVHLYLAAGSYPVKLFTITDKGCLSDTAIANIVINPLPTAQFNILSTVCAQRAVVFSNTSIANVGDLTNSWWDFGDGVNENRSTTDTFHHYFSPWGNYSIQLQVTSSKGCKSDTLKKVQKINPLPKVGFILPEICLADAAADLIDTTSIEDNKLSGLTWKWRIDKGKFTNAQPVFIKDNVQNARVQVTKSDKYLTTLLVTSADGCKDSVFNELTVNGSTPKASFTIVNENGLCGNDSIRIINTSTVDFGAVSNMEVRWDFDNAPSAAVVDAFPEQLKIYAKKYIDFQTPATKSYKIKLTAFSGNALACQNSISQTIVLNRSPKVSFSLPTPICNDAAIQAINPAASTFPGVPGTPVYSGAGIVDPVKGLFNPAVSGPGTFPIKYLHESDKGCRDSLIRSIKVWPSPVAIWSSGNPACEKNTLLFTDSSTTSVGKIITRNWIFGDGQTQTQLTANSFTHIYAAAGNYTASLQVITDSGCVSTLTQKTIKINPLPLVAFQMPNVCLPDGNGTFINQSSIADKSEALFSYRWNFNDPNDPSNSTLQNPTHRYTDLGPYPLQLIITTKDGCVDSLTQLMKTIYPQPLAKFATNPTEVCVGGSIQFIDKSISQSAPVVEWNWDLAQGNGSVQQNPSRVMADSGNFTIRLYIKDGKGCVSDTSIATVTAHPYPVLQLTNSLKVLEGGTITLKPVYYGTQLLFDWTPSLYLDTATIATPKATPPDDITYRLTLTGIGGCSVSDTAFIKVLKSPLVPNAFSPNGDGINDTWRIQYLESYPGASIEVFNRNGQKVFESTGYNVEWDGYFKGALLPVGTYYYIINPKNGRKTLSGSVTIIR